MGEEAESWKIEGEEVEKFSGKGLAGRGNSGLILMGTGCKIQS